MPSFNLSKPEVIRTADGQTKTKTTPLRDEDGNITEYRKEQVPYAIYRKYVRPSGDIIRVPLDTHATRRDPDCEESVKKQRRKQKQGFVPYDECPRFNANFRELMRNAEANKDVNLPTREECDAHMTEQDKRYAIEREFEAWLKEEPNEYGYKPPFRIPLDQIEWSEDYCCGCVSEIARMRKLRMKYRMDKAHERAKTVQNKTLENAQEFQKELLTKMHEHNKAATARMDAAITAMERDSESGS